LCQALKRYVDGRTGQETAWTDVEHLSPQRYPATRPVRRPRSGGWTVAAAAVAGAVLLALTGCACSAIPGTQLPYGVVPFCRAMR